MKKGRRRWATVALYLLAAPSVWAQIESPDLSTLEARVEALQAQQQALLKENARLRGTVQDLATRQSNLEREKEELASQVGDRMDAALETEIAALADRLTGTTVQSAANPVTLTGEFRLRSVWATVEPTGSDEFSGWWTDARLRLGFQYDFSRSVTAFAELQSHWAYGGGAPSSGGTPFGPLDFGETSTPVNLYQGWVEVRDVFNRPELSLKLGRQEVVLGNQYQFGNAEWYSGWVFDGARVDWDTDDFALTGMYFKLNTGDLDVNQLHSALSDHDDDELLSLYFTLKSIENHTIDLYWIYVNGHGGVPGGSGVSTGSLGTPVGGGGFAFGSSAYFHTLGARINGRFPDVAAGLDYNVEAAYQFGDANGSAVSDVDGFSVEGEVGLTFDKDSAFRIYVRGLFAEGVEGNDSGYVPLYPNRHANSGFLGRYGLLDALPMFNVVSLQGGFMFKPANDWLLGATVVWSTADEPLFGGDDDYGWELDLWSAYVHSENLVFIFAAFAVFPDDQLEALVGIEDDTIFGVVFQTRLTF